MIVYNAKMFSFKFVNLIILLQVFCSVYGALSDKRLCANENCSQIVSEGITLTNYPAGESGMLSFRSNQNVKIYSKPAGTNMKLLGVEINNQRGYAPTEFIRETKVIISNLSYVVDTEFAKSSDNKVLSTQVDDRVKPDPVKKPYEVVDGTTIYLNDQENQNQVDNNVKGTPKKSPQDEIVKRMPDVKEAVINPQKSLKPSNVDNKSNELKEANDAPKEKSKQDEDDEDLEYEDDDDEIDDIDDEDEDDNENIVDKDPNDIEFRSSGEIVPSKAEKKTNLPPDGIVSNKQFPEEIVMKKIEIANDKLDENFEPFVPESITIYNSEEPKLTTEKIDTNEFNQDFEGKTEKLGNEIEELNENPLPGMIEIEKEENILKDFSDKIEDERKKLDENLEPFISADSINNPENVKFVNSEIKNERNKLNENLQIAAESKGKEMKKLNQIFQPQDTVFKNSGDSQHTHNKIDEEKTKLDENLEPFTPQDVTINNPEKLEASFDNKNQRDLLIDNSLKDLKRDYYLADTDTQKNEIRTENKESVQLSPWNMMSDLVYNKENVENVITSSSSVEDKDIIEEEKEINEEKEESKEEVITTENSEESDSSNENSTEGYPLFSAFANMFGTSGSDDNSSDDVTNQEQNEDNTNAEEHATSVTETTTGTAQNFDAPLYYTATTDSTYTEAITDKPLKVDDTADVPVQPQIQEIPLLDRPHNVPEKTYEDLMKTDERVDEIVRSSEKIYNENSNVDTIIKEAMEHLKPARDLEHNDNLMDTGNTKNHEMEKPNEDQQTNYLNSNDNIMLSKNIDDATSPTCDMESSPNGYCEAKNKLANFYDEFKMQTIADSINLDFSEIYNLLIVLAITAISVVIFLWGYIFLDKSRREAPLIAKVNNLEKSLLVAKKENQLLTEKIQELDDNVLQESVSNEYVENLKSEVLEMKNKCLILEDEKQSLEKELENSTEVGLELNRMLNDILSSQNGSETLIANIEQLQRQLVEQQSTINTMNASMAVKDTENHELQLELEICNKKVLDLQSELDKMVENLLKIEEEKEQVQNKLKKEIFSLEDKLKTTSITFTSDNIRLKDEMNALTEKYRNLERKLEVKCNEYDILKQSVDVIKTSKNKAETIKNLMDVTEIKAKFEQLQDENGRLTLQLKKEEENKYDLQAHLQRLLEDANSWKTKYEEADKHKLEAQTKLEVLQNYFTDREAQLQKEITKHESVFLEKQGEATSTTERIKFMQSELQNYKSQYESLKQELVSQEVELKSQISVLEKKAHENWVSARQAERKLEDVKQEAAQLRNRLTLRERNMSDDKGQNRMQSPLEPNGDLTMSPIHMSVESPASPPLLYGAHEHVTTSPPLPNLPPPYLPMPPFMPPPIPGVPPPFMPPPPSMFPGDHRPPPLGRMSSPPLNSRYSSDSRAYSPYDRNSPSPSYDEDYGSSLPLHRTFSPYNSRDDRRDYKRPAAVRNSVRNNKNSTNYSSGSANSNESIEKINGRHHSKV